VENKKGRLIMKKILGLAALLVVMGLYTPAKAEPVFGFIYKDATESAGVASEVAPSKVGEATCTSYFGIVGLGRCGVKEAMKNGGISSLAFYDTYTKNILGYKKVTTKAYGR
jgi:hypothetical protein